ncbi:MAG: archease [Desulfurococcales archaeon]|nr:archease [Desulfurococcales archaeon]
MECPGFEFGEHTADVLVKARGRTLEEAFEWAAIATYEIMTDTTRVKPLRRIHIDVNGMDLENLLYNFIEELLYHTDSEGVVFSRLIRVCRIDREGDNYRLEAYAWGDVFDPEKYEHRTIVKAMTYAQMEVARRNDCWELTFVPDI